jgi:hypothetical protein
MLNDLRRDLFARYLKDGARSLDRSVGAARVLGIERVLALASATVRHRGTTTEVAAGRDARRRGTVGDPLN